MRLLIWPIVLCLVPPTLPLVKKYRVGAINWGLVEGKSQTHLPRDSWQHPYTTQQAAIWFHEVFHTDSKSYRQREVEITRKLH